MSDRSVTVQLVVSLDLLVEALLALTVLGCPLPERATLMGRLELSTSTHCLIHLVVPGFTLFFIWKWFYSSPSVRPSPSVSRCCVLDDRSFAIVTVRLEKRQPKAPNLHALLDPFG